MSRQKKNAGSEDTAETTVEKVARLAGVSIVTVSRAMNNSSMVAPATRERILAVARQVGYRPNPVARALRKQRSNSIAILLKAKHLRGQFYPEMLAGFHSIVHSRELSVLVAVAPDSEDPIAWMHSIMQGAVYDGVVIHNEFLRQISTGFTKSLGIPLVVAGLIPSPNTSQKKLCMVGFNHIEGTKQAVRYLVSLGHKRIGFFNDLVISFIPSARERAFRQEMKASGIDVNSDWVVNCPSDDLVSAGSQAVQKLLSRPTPHPTAIICGNDLLAVGAVSGAKAWGKSVPEQLSVIGYGNALWSSVVTPPLSSVHQRGWELGVGIAQRLMKLCDGEQSSGELVLPMHIVVRGSTGPPADR